MYEGLFWAVLLANFRYQEWIKALEYSTLICEPVSADTPCGISLEDDTAFYNFILSAEGTQEKFDGKTTIPAEPPDWRVTKKQALEFLKSTKDLKLVSILAQAVLNTEGLGGFHSCLNGILELMKANWRQLYPSLEHDSPDPSERVMERVSALGLLAHATFVLDTLRNLPLANSRVFGHVTLRKVNNSFIIEDVESKALESSQIVAIFKDEDQSKIYQAYETLNKCRNLLVEINATIIQLEPDAHSVNFDELFKVLSNMMHVFEKYADIKSVASMKVSDSSETSAIPDLPDIAANSSNFIKSKFDSSWEINNRDDVGFCIDKICDYFRKYEPSSPIPILLMRAKKLVHMDFLDIIKDVAPEALENIQKLGGISEN